jgi:hypothetical protein
LENKLLIFLKQLIIYPTHATFGAGKINYAPLCEVNRLYGEHGADFRILCLILLASPLQKSA